MTGEADLRPYARMLAEAAGRAPSLHNTQPWRLRVRPDVVELWLDPARVLPVADPAGRQAQLGLGAATFTLRLALAKLGWAAATELRPDHDRPDLVARVRVGGARQATAAERGLLTALGVRRTVRTPFRGEEIPVPLRVAWGDHAAGEGGVLRWVEQPGERRGVAGLVARAERLQQTDPAFRAELAAWTGTTAGGEGVPAHALGVTAAAGHAAEFALRDFAGGRELAARHHGPVEDHPTVAVLGTDGDRPEDWLRGGQALMRVLLVATVDGYAASFLNQPIELPGLRRELRDELRMPGWPQLILRLGRPLAPLTAMAPRRSVDDLLLDENADPA